VTSLLSHGLYTFVAHIRKQYCINISDAPGSILNRKNRTDIEKTDPTFLKNQTIFGFVKKIEFFVSKSSQQFINKNFSFSTVFCLV